MMLNNCFLGFKKSINIYFSAILVSSGNIIELFNFMLFPILAVYISKVFFPVENQTYAMIAAYGVALTGYLSRPLGSLLLGHWSDKYGRKKILTYTILVTSVCSLIVSLTPSAEKIGFAAPLILVVMRFIQGLCVSGEEGGAAVYLAETFGPKKIAFSSSIVLSGIYLGVLSAMITCSTVELFLVEEEMLSWGWRVPFFCVFLVGLVFTLLRSNIKETQDFINHKITVDKNYSPLIDLLTNYKKEILKLLFLSGAYSSTAGLLMIFLPNTIPKDAIPRSVFVLSILIISIILPVAGYFSDRIGPRKIMYLSLLVSFPLLFIVAFLLYYQHEYIAGISLLSLLLVAMASSILPLLIESFPVQIRCTGVSFTFNSSICLFCGIFPILTTYIDNALNIQYGWIFMIYGVTLLSLVIIVFDMKTTKYSKRVMRIYDLN